MPSGEQKLPVRGWDQNKVLKKRLTIATAVMNSLILNFTATYGSCSSEESTGSSLILDACEAMYQSSGNFSQRVSAQKLG